MKIIKRTVLRPCVALTPVLPVLMQCSDTVAGGGTDAAFAALSNAKPVIERFGLLSLGAHSNDNEYVHISKNAFTMSCQQT
jgi:hypothetical protein